MAETLGDPVFDGREHLQPAVVHDPDFRAVGVQHRLGSSVVMRPSRDFRTRAQLIDRIARACSVLDILCYQLRRLAGCPFPGEIQSLLRLSILVAERPCELSAQEYTSASFRPFQEFEFTKNRFARSCWLNRNALLPIASESPEINFYHVLHLHQIPTGVFPGCKVHSRRRQRRHPENGGPRPSLFRARQQALFPGCRWQSLPRFPIGPRRAPLWSCARGHGCGDRRPSEAGHPLGGALFNSHRARRGFPPPAICNQRLGSA